MSEMIGDRALRVFAQNLAAKREDVVSLDALCKQHPELESQLRELDQRRSEARTHAPFTAMRETEAGTGEATLTMESTPSTSGHWVTRYGSDPSRYMLLGDIARGGAGVVLHVWDTVFRRPLAMKVLDIDSRAGSSEDASRAVARFLEEAHVAGKLEHPGVVPIYDLGADDSGRVYFTMPLIEGRDLNEVFDLARKGEEGWSISRALHVLLRVCDVVAYAHSREVIHRDLKPSNVMVGKFGEVYVIDWGLAKSVGASEKPPPKVPQQPAEESPAGQTLEGTVLGTPSYMAAEQANGQLDEVSFTTDVYALGAMLYRLLAGRSPYAPRSGEQSGAHTLELVRRGPPTPVERIAPEAPAELVAICEKAMARDPEERYPSIVKLAGEIEAFVDGRVVHAYERGFWAESKKLVLRNRFNAAMIGALVLTAFAAMGIVTWMHARLNHQLEAKNEQLRAAQLQVLDNAVRAEERE